VTQRNSGEQLTFHSFCAIREVPSLFHHVAFCLLTFAFFLREILSTAFLSTSHKKGAGRWIAPPACRNSYPGARPLGLRIKILLTEDRGAFRSAGNVQITEGEVPSGSGGKLRCRLAGDVREQSRGKSVNNSLVGALRGVGSVLVELADGPEAVVAAGDHAVVALESIGSAGGVGLYTVVGESLDESTALADKVCRAGVSDDVAVTGVGIGATSTHLTVPAVGHGITDRLAEIATGEVTTVSCSVGNTVDGTCDGEGKRVIALEVNVLLDIGDASNTSLGERQNAGSGIDVTTREENTVGVVSRIPREQGKGGVAILGDRLKLAVGDVVGGEVGRSNDGEVNRGEIANFRQSNALHRGCLRGVETADGLINIRKGDRGIGLDRAVGGTNVALPTSTGSVTGNLGASGDVERKEVTLALGSGDASAALGAEKVEADHVGGNADLGAVGRGDNLPPKTDLGRSGQGTRATAVRSDEGVTEVGGGGCESRGGDAVQRGGTSNVDLVSDSVGGGGASGEAGTNRKGGHEGCHELIGVHGVCCVGFWTDRVFGR